VIMIKEILIYFHNDLIGQIWKTWNR